MSPVCTIHQTRVANQQAGTTLFNGCNLAVCQWEINGKGRAEWNPEVVFADVRRNLFGFQEGQQFFDCHFYNGREELVMDLRNGAPVST